VAENRYEGWDQGLCDGCLRAGEAAVAGLVLDYVDLEQHIAAPRGAVEHVSGTRAPPIPLALGVEALQREIWLITVTWAEVLVDVDRLAELPGRVRDGYAVQWAAAIIAPRVGRLAALPPTTVMPYGPDGEAAEHTGAEGLLAMVALHGRVRAALGLTRLVHELPGECRSCGQPFLRRENGSDEIFCAGCFAWWGSSDDYHAYAELVAGQRKVKRRRREAGSPQGIP